MEGVFQRFIIQSRFMLPGAAAQPQGRDGSGEPLH